MHLRKMNFEGFIIFIGIFVLALFIISSLYHACRKENNEFTDATKLTEEGWLSNNDSNKIKVMSFNVKNGGEGVNTVDVRQPRILELFQNYYPDLIGYQEVTKDWIDWFSSDAFSELYAFYGKPRDPSKSNSEYSLIMYNYKKFTLLDSGDFWLNEEVLSDPTSASTAIGWDAALPRCCSWIRLEDINTKTQFVIMNVHFDHKGMQAVIHSSELMLKMADSWDIPVIITGDFNSSEYSAAYGVLSSGNYDNTKYIAETTMSWATSPGFFKKGTQYGEVIDHILISKDTFMVDSYSVITQDFGGGRVSDHYPIISVLSTN